MSIPLLKGRLFDSTDSARSPAVALVSQGAVRQFWPDADPIGATVATALLMRRALEYASMFRMPVIDHCEDPSLKGEGVAHEGPTAGLLGRRFEARVVGVVGEVRHETLDRPARAELFLPHAQSGFGSMSVVVRTAPGSALTIRTLKEQVWALDPALSIYSSGTLDHLVSRTLTGRRFNLFLLSGFAAATLLLATAGVFALVSFSTTQRWPIAWALPPARACSSASRGLRSLSAAWPRTTRRSWPSGRARVA